MSRCDVVVVGLGAMGSAAAWHLARRGRRVIGVEQHEPGHTLGSSHGASRIFRFAYEHDDYVRLAVESLRLWRELEDESGAELLTRTGAIDYGTDPVLARIGASMSRNGVACELLERDEAQRRWTGFRFPGPVLHQADGGRVDADATRLALQSRAGAAGADLRFSDPVAVVDPRPGGVVVSTAGDEIEAEVAVVTTNAWTAGLLSGVVDLPALRITQEQPVFFAPRDATAQWPSFIHYLRDATLASAFGCYGLASPAEGGVKVGEHGTGVEVDPAGGRPPVDPEGIERVSAYVAAHLPGLDPEPLSAVRCLYATTPTEDFVIDRVGPVVVGAGFSGHGFKFVPAVGRILADLADGSPQTVPRFALPA